MPKLLKGSGERLSTSLTVSWSSSSSSGVMLSIHGLARWTHGAVREEILHIKSYPIVMLFLYHDVVGWYDWLSTALPVFLHELVHLECFEGDENTAW